MKLVKTFNYQDQAIDFDLSKNNVMVNATEMAKIFNDKPYNFLTNEQTKKFIEACLSIRNSGYLNIEKEEDLFITNKNSCTWMHRVLALKFAAWLNPTFELWVYSTIEDLLFGYAKRIENTNKERAIVKKRIAEIEMYLRTETEVFAELEVLRLKDRQFGYQLNKENNSQLNLFLDNE
jgi:hypothetical protein